MEEFLKKIEKEYGIDEETFKKLVIVGIIALILAGIGIYMLLDSMKVKTLPYNELKTKVESLWNQAKSKGATTEEDFRKYIIPRLSKVNYRQFTLNISENGVEVVDRVGSLNKYGFFFEIPYQVVISSDAGYSKYAIVFHEDGTADTYAANEESQYNLVCDTLQVERNIKYGTRSAILEEYTLQFTEDGHDIVMVRIPSEEEGDIPEEELQKYAATSSYDEVHGIYREYAYVGIVEDQQTAIVLSASNKLTIAQENGTKELQIRTDCGDHRIIYEGGLYATLSLDGKTLKIGSDILQINETPYRLNIEQPEYPGMKVKLVEGSSVDALKAGNPKTGDVIIYNDYMYVCNKHFVKDEWVVFNENEENPEWGVRVLSTEYELVADMEDEIFGVPVTMLSYTYADCLRIQYAPKVSANAKEMKYTFSGCSSLLYAPRIPENVTDMTKTFSACSQMETASALPSKVKVLERTFEKCSELVNPVKVPEKAVNVSGMYDGCKVLKGAIRIDSKVIETYDSMFGGTNETIILSGKCEEDMLRLLAATSDGKNVKLASDPEVDTGDGYTEI